MSEQYEAINKQAENNLTYFAIKVFSTEDGKRLLEELKKEFLLDHVAPPGCHEHYPYYREGQNDIIKMFMIAAEGKK